MVGLALIFSLAGCELFYPSESMRYRIAVTVDTPEGPRSGSSVVESTIRAVPRLAEHGGVNYDLRGEAVAIPLPDGEMLFALLRHENSSASDYQSRLLRTAACDEGKPSMRPAPDLCKGGQWEDFRIWAKEHQLSAELSRSSYPILVTFRDINDPTTVEEVDPADLAATFGPGYSLRRITVEITDEPVTSGIWKRFPWWDDYMDRHFDGSPSSSKDMTTDSLAAHLSSRSFSTEYEK
jgi:hypothetical protein